MRKPRSTLGKLLSFNQYRKRFGANKIAANLADFDSEKLKNTLIDSENTAYTFGADKDLQQHIANLKKEFHGQSELAYYHAQLIVLIRREYDTKNNVQKFMALWSENRDFFIHHLSTRWLISAADTFIDYSDNLLESAILMNAILLINTLKLQETERYLCENQNQTINPQRAENLKTERLALFDGTSGFVIGTDDSLRNMRWRLDKICAQHPSGKIVIEIFNRVQNHDTVYQRFKSKHHREKTAWW